MFAIVEFAEDDGGGVSLINTSWLTPRKKEVFWPPVKDSVKFNKIVRDINQSVDENSWGQYNISRIFYECDDYEKAKRKLKEAEHTSDLNTDIESNCRKRFRPRRIFEESSSEEESSSRFVRPPKIKLVNSKIADIAEGSQNYSCSRTISGTGTPPTSRCASEASQNYSCPKTTKAGTPSTSKSIIIKTPTVENISDKHVLTKILEKLVKIEVQNEQIFNFLQTRKDIQVPKISTSCPKLPCSLPLKSVEDIQLLEDYLSEENTFNSMSSYLASLGGNSITARTNRILRQLLNDRIASSYSFFGRRKRDFHILQVAKLIKCSVKLGIPNSTEKEIEDVVKVWLKHAPERCKKAESLEEK